jgi:MinD-like ATPase involved in chromosome partitioning or flagellar assembly
MTASAFLRALEKVGEVDKVFVYPYVKLIVRSSLFSGQSDSEREETLSRTLGITIDELRRTTHNCLFLLRLADTNEVHEKLISRSTHWLAGLTHATSSAQKETIRAVHFYGYKGGQARSTLAAALAVAQSQDGWKVLVIDADLEAPSLDTIFAASSKSLSSTLLGVSQGFERILPLTVYAPRQAGRGTVDLINCWPRLGGYDIDTAAFALRSALEPTVIETALMRIADYAKDNKYDLLIVDHRTGLSPSILPSLATLPGPIAITVRLDEQWQPAKGFLSLLLNTHASEPGLFIVWKPDSEDERSFQQRTYRQREELLELLADAYRFQSGSLFLDDDVSTTELEDHIVVWPYDEAFRTSRLPESDALSHNARESLSQVRSLLGLGESRIGEPPAKPAAFSSGRITNISGAKDQGDLLVTRALRELLAPSNPYTYILGRKGTGKTRLARELSIRGIGEPLLVPDDSEDNRGLRSTSPELRDAASLCSDSPERFWLALFNAAVQVRSTQRDKLAPAFLSAVKALPSASTVIGEWSKAEGYRTFLLDSLETAFPSRQMVPFLDGLFRVLSMIETDPRAAERIGFRLFLRQDLAQRGFIQNLEQQVFGKALELSWDYQSILNFMLSRIALHPWYSTHFPQLVRAIDESKPDILSGAVSSLRCEELLQIAFPSTVRRNNLRTTTFFRTYFADTATERAPGNSPAGSDTRRYYPRVFDEFIRTIPRDVNDQDAIEVSAVDDEGKINQTRIFRAHETAAESYLQGLKQELAYVIALSDDFADNQELIDKLLNSFDGLQTPFQVEKRVDEIAQRTDIPAKQVRTALEKMKDVGMFEARPDYPGEWRVGRLFKSSLRLKYVRGRHTDD